MGPFHLPTNPTPPHSLQLESSLAGSEHWAASLPPPVNVGLRVVHKALQAVALSVQSDHKGLAKLRGANSIFVGEVYTIEAIPDTRARSASCDFVARSRAERVTLRIDRTTSDVTLSVVVRKPSGRADFEQELGVPSGVRYSVWHKAVGVEVSSGYTDAVGKAVLRRKGTLFVGETYVARVAAGNGLESSSCEFVVVPQHIETTLFIKRACADLEFEFTSRLAGSNHWAASVFLPSAIPFEVRSIHTGPIPLALTRLPLHCRLLDAHRFVTPPKTDWCTRGFTRPTEELI